MINSLLLLIIAFELAYIIYRLDSLTKVKMSPDEPEITGVEDVKSKEVISGASPDNTLPEGVSAVIIPAPTRQSRAVKEHIKRDEEIGQDTDMEELAA